MCQLQLLRRSIIAQGSLSYAYTLPVRLESLYPPVLFTRGAAVVSIRATNLVVNTANNNLLCVWQTRNRTQFPAESANSKLGSLLKWPRTQGTNGAVVITLNTSASLSADGQTAQCLSPANLPSGLHEVSLSMNGAVETNSFLQVRFVDEPVIQSMTRPARAVVGYNATLSILGSGFWTESIEPVCVFQRGSVGSSGVLPGLVKATVGSVGPIVGSLGYPRNGGVNGTVFTATNQAGGPQSVVMKVPAVFVSDSVVRCQVPMEARSVREQQRVYVSAPKPIPEIQSLEVTALPNQIEVQRVALNTWGTQNEIWKLRAGTKLVSGDMATYKLETSSDFKSEVQHIQIKPTAYKQQTQTITIVARVTVLEEQYRLQEDSGYMKITMGNSFTSQAVYWNASEAQMKQVLLSNSAVRDVDSVTKTITTTQKPPKVVGTAPHTVSIPTIQTSITWTIIFGASDGDKQPIDAIVDVSTVPRANMGFGSGSITQSSTIANTGVSCEVQMIQSRAASTGSFTLRYGKYTTSDISVDSPASTVRTIILASILSLKDVRVTRVDATWTTRRWFVTFIASPGDLPLLEVVSSNLFPLIATGDPAASTQTVLVSEVVKGQAMALSGNVVLKGGGLTSDVSVPVSATSTEIINALTNAGQAVSSVYIPTDTTDQYRLYSSIQTYDWFIQFDKIKGNVAPFSVDVSGLTAGTLPVVAIVEEIVPGSNKNQPLSGFINLKSRDDILSIPSNAQPIDVSNALQALGYGATTVTRTVVAGGYGAFVWSITFAEATSASPFDQLTALPAGLVSNSDVKVTLSRLSAPAASCCLSDVSFTLKTTVAGVTVTSSTLSLSSTVSDMTSAISNLLSISPQNFTVNQVSTPAGGKTWFIEFLNQAPPVPRSSVIVAPVSPLTLVTDPSKAELVLTTYQTLAVPMTQQVYIHAGSTINGFFRLGFAATTSSPLMWTPYLPVDISYQRLEDHFTFSLGITSVRIRPTQFAGDDYKGPVPAMGHPGDYRAFNVEFTSVAGLVPTLLCDTKNVTSLYSSTAECLVSTVVSASSVAAGGFFNLTIDGKTTRGIHIDASDSVVKSAIEAAIPSLSVSVTKRTMEPDGDSEWLVTFNVNRGDEPLMTADITGVTGTKVNVEISELQRGSQLSGNYSLMFGAEHSPPIRYDETGYNIQRILNTFDDLAGSVKVSQATLSTGRRYLITFDSAMGDVNLIRVSSDVNLKGEQAAARVYEVRRGVGAVQGEFRLSYKGMETSTLSTQSTAQDVEVALEALPNIGDVSVVKSPYVPYSPNPASTSTIEWFVTFTTLGSPVNAGSEALLVPSYAAPLDGKFAIHTEQVSAACCNVSLSYNDGYELTSSSAAVVVDEMPVVLSISPTTGNLQGGVNVTVLGIGFFHSTEPATCVFGSVESPISIVNDSRAYCISPPHPVGRVVVAVKLNRVSDAMGIGGSGGGAISRSIASFLYEAPLALLWIAPGFGQIDKVTQATLQLAEVGSIQEPLQCMWNVSIISPTLGVVGPLALTTPTRRINDTFASCLTPVLDSFVVDRVSDTSADARLSRWYLDTNASATVAVTKNAQIFSNSLPFFFYSKPSVASISPYLGGVGGGTVITLTGSNFIKQSPEARCKIGSSLVPVTVISSSTAVCTAPATPIMPAVHSIQVMVPVLRTEVQVLEIKQRTDGGRAVWLTGNISLGLEGYFTDHMSITALSIKLLKSKLQALPRIKKVSVNQSSVNSTEPSSGYSWRVDAFVITFSARDDDVPTLKCVIDGVHGWREGDRIDVITTSDGGSDVSLPQVQEWGLLQQSKFKEVQRIRVPISASLPLGGSFKLGVTDTNKTTDFLSVDSRPIDITEAIQSLLPLASLNVTMGPKPLGSIRYWDVTFSEAAGALPLLTIADSSKLASGASANVTMLQTGSKRLSGSYILRLMGASLNIPVSATKDKIQMIIQNDVTVSSMLKDKVVLVDDLTADIYHPTFKVTLPVSAGRQGDISLTLPSSFSGENSTKFARTIQYGTYQPIGGTFKLSVDGSNTSAIAYDASAAAVRSALLALPTVTNISVTLTTGIQDYFGYSYTGSTWVITFAKVLQSQYQGVIDFVLYSSSLSGRDTLAVHQELVTGHGPFQPVEISFDSQHYTEDRNMFELVETIVIKKISPRSGPHTGRTRILVSIMPVHRTLNTLLAYQPQCKFSSVFTPARFLDDSSIECYSPAYGALDGGDVVVSIALNNQDLSGNNATFTYRPAVHSLSLHPILGTTDGGTIVNITGDTIKAAVGAYCAFDDDVVPADYSTDGLLSCRSPPVPHRRTVAVSFSFNGQDYMNNTGLQFKYVDPPVVTRIDPVRGASTGNTRVRVLGQNFVEADRTALCRFGDQVVNSTLNTDSSMSCISPPLKRVYEVQTIDVGVKAFTPKVQRLSVTGTKPFGESITIKTSAAPYDPHVVSLSVSVPEVNSVQQIILEQDFAPPALAQLKLKNTGRVKELQVLSTVSNPIVEKQAIILRTSFSSYASSYAEVVSIKYTGKYLF